MRYIMEASVSSSPAARWSDFPARERERESDPRRRHAACCQPRPTRRGPPQIYICRVSFAPALPAPRPRARERRPKIALLHLGRWPAEGAGKARAHTRIGALLLQPHRRTAAMFDDLLKLFRNSPRWANSPLARRLGFSAELSYEEDDAGTHALAALTWRLTVGSLTSCRSPPS